MALLTIFLFICLIGTLCYHKANRLLSSLLIFAYCLIMASADLWSYWVLLLAIVVLLPLLYIPIRRSFISTPALQIFQKIIPTMSKTEQEAIEAGTTWWESDLFQGMPNWDKLHNYPKPQLTNEEQAFLNGPVEEACRIANDFQISHELADLPTELWQYLKKHRFFAMIIKKEYDGLEFSAYAQALILQKLSGVSSILAITVGVPNSLGPGELLQHYGTDEQKQYYLPRLAQGKEIPCFALTSPEAGSDAGAIPDTGIICMGEWKNQQILGMRLNWNKRYITLAPIATVLGLAFKLYDPDHLLGDITDLGITCALIPTNVAGVEIGHRHFPLNIPFQNGPTRGKDIFVPIDYIIGGAKMAGQGWRMLMECLSIGRGITLPSNATGSLKSIAMAIGAYAYIRRQFKLPIGKMEGIEEPLARIAGNAYLMDAASTLITTAIISGEKPAVLSAIVKYHCTHRGQHAIIDAMDIAGGKGICMGPSNFLARFYQGAPIAITVEGANILTRSMMIFGQGAIRCHPYILSEIAAAQNNDIATFDKLLFNHLSYTISNLFRSFWLGLTNGRTSKTPTQDTTRRFYQQLNRQSANLALLADISMGVLGGGLKRRERISARLGDILSHLYLASATLKRYEDDGRPTMDLPIVEWVIKDCLFQSEKAMKALLYNFPNRLIAMLTRIIIFPFGYRYAPPNDQLDHKLAKIMMTPSETRDRIGRGQYMTPSEHNPHGLINAALLDIIAAEPIFERLVSQNAHKPHFINLDKLAKQALADGKITQQEADILRKAEASRLRSINVDEFEYDALVVPSKKFEKQKNSSPLDKEQAA